jgi:signal transduction histidine kinase
MFTNWSIRRRLVLIAVTVTALVILIVILLVLNASAELIARQTQTSLIERNGRTAAVLDTHLQSVAAITRTLATTMSRSNISPVSTLWRSANTLLHDGTVTRIGVIRPYHSGYQTAIFRQPSGTNAAPLTLFYDRSFPANAVYAGIISSGEIHWQWAARAYRATNNQPVIVVANRIGSTLLWVEFPANRIQTWLAAAVGEDAAPYQLVLSDGAAIFGGYDSTAPRATLMLGESAVAELLNTPSDSVLPTVANPFDDDSAAYMLHSRLSTNSWQITGLVPVTAVQNPFSQRTLQIVLIGLAGVFVLGWLLARFSKNALSIPLTDLTLTTQEIGSGDMRYQIGYRDQSDEIGKLARALEDMKLNLAHSLESLSLWSHTLEQRVAQRTSELEVARAEALTTATELRLVYDSSLSIVSDYHLQTILQTLVERVRSLLRATYAAIWLITPDQQHLQLVASTAEDRNVIGRLIGIHEGLSGAVVQHRAPMRLDNYLTWERRLGWNAPEMDRALSVPMIFSGDAIGSIIAGRPTETPVFTEDDQRLLTLLANLISPVVRNGQLFVQLDEAVKAAERASEVKTRFLASVTHELRTPLNLIINNMDFMRIGVFGEVNDDQRTRLDQTIRSAEHLLYLINDLLDVSKIEAGEMQLFFQPNELQPVLEDALDSAMAQMDTAKPVALVAHIPDHLPTVTMDARRVRQVLSNLLSNAVKFTEEGEVTFIVQAHPDHIEFTVRDTGIGIPADELGGIFEAFERSTRAKEMGIEGTGLGLPISRYLVQQHGGELTVETEMGKGTTFRFTLPLTPPEPKNENGRDSIAAVLGQPTQAENLANTPPE